jgi:hypothetical protein
MPDVVSFRPTAEEESMIEQARRALGARTRTEAVRFLLAAGARSTGNLADDPVWKVRAPREFWIDKSVTSREVDEKLYGTGAP